MIQALADRLCDDIPFVDEETGQEYIVVSVERNQDPELVVKGKPHLKFNGLVVWALPVDGSKWRSKLTPACKTNPTWRYRECVPMDPSDFDVIPFVSTTTPVKKRVRRGPDDCSPEKNWKPTLESRRGSKGKIGDAVVQKFIKQRLDLCSFVDAPCSACVWLFRALNTASEVLGSDFRCCMSTALESASIADIITAFSLVLNIDIEMPLERSVSKVNFLRKCVDDVIQLAKNSV